MGNAVCSQSAVHVAGCSQYTTYIAGCSVVSTFFFFLGGGLRERHTHTIPIASWNCRLLTKKRFWPYRLLTAFFLHCRTWELHVAPNVRHAWCWSDVMRSTRKLLMSVYRASRTCHSSTDFQHDVHCQVVCVILFSSQQILFCKCVHMCVSVHVCVRERGRS